MTRFFLLAALVIASVSCLTTAQQFPVGAARIVVPRLIHFGGVVSNAVAGRGVVGITFALYKDQQGGAPLWLETQNVPVDPKGRYSALLGASKAEGVPMDLFTSGEARWLGVQVEGQTEQARVLLVAVPYALKAADAETLGGRPASAFALAPAEAAGGSVTKAKPKTAPSASNSVSPAITGTGTGNFIARWTTSTNLGNAAIYQAPTTNNIGIGNSAPAAKLDVQIAGGLAIRGMTTSGTGIQGRATATTGSTAGVRALVSSPSGTAGYFDNMAGGEIASFRNNGVEEASIDGTGAVTGIRGIFKGNGLYPWTMNVIQPGNGDAIDISNAQGTGIYVDAPNGLSLVTNSPVSVNYTAGPAFIATGGVQVGGLTTNPSGGTVVAGFSGTITGNGSHGFIGGGITNTVDGGTSAVVGGAYNTASRDSGNNASAAVLGGEYNTASGHDAVVVGGWANSATGSYAVTVGGFDNTASAYASFAGGYNAQALHQGSFVWGDTQGIPGNKASTGRDEFLVHAAGGVFFISADNAVTGAPIGVKLAPGSGSWSSLSDRNSKAEFQRVDGRTLLARLNAIPIQTWRYNTQPASIRHIGPVAQDFHAAFGVGEDNQHISLVDADGVALAAIQALYRLNLAKDKKIERLEKRLVRLERASRAKPPSPSGQYSHQASRSAP